MNFQDIIEYIKVPKNAFIVGITVTIVVLMFALTIIKNKQTKKLLADFDFHYNEIKSMNLSFNLQRILGLAKSNADVAKAIPKCEVSYNEVQATLMEISEIIGEADDFIFMHKPKKALERIKAGEEKINSISSKAEALDEFMNTILQNVKDLLPKCVRLREIFRSIKETCNSEFNGYSIIKDYFESECQEIEEMFPRFEGQVYGNLYDAARQSLNNITQKITDLQNLVDNTPAIVELANGKIATMCTDVNNLFLQAREIGVVLTHLEIVKNLDMIQEVVRQDLTSLANGKYEDCNESLETCVTRLNQLTQQIEREAKAYEQFTYCANNLSKDIVDKIEEMNQFSISYEKHRDRFGYEDWSKFISDKKAQLSALHTKIQEVITLSKQKETPYSTTLITIKEYEDALIVISKEIHTLSEKLNMACLDENRAIKQSEKLQLIMHEVKVKIRENHLPSIGDAYEADMRNGYRQLESIKSLLGETPLNLEALNASLNVAIDNIYRLYNNVNNLIGTAKMVENALLYGNKYRSTYPDVDSELTRAELCFRNGEYTQALTIAIQMIEKIHPGSYERLIRAEKQLGSN